jgi:arylsulfatase A-like enzyme
VGKSKQGPYGDAVEEIDFHVGRILDHLKKVGVDGNTIVIYTSDNGPWLNKGINGGSAKPLFEGKFTTFEGGMRVPFIIRWPGKIPANTVSSEMALSMDLHPTLAKLVGAEAPAGVDGLNIMDLWTTIGAKSPHDYFFYVNGDKESLAVRYKDWKYHRRERPHVDKTTHQAKSPTLYNLKNDIGESTNVIREHPEIAEQLDKALEQHLRWISEKL